MANPLFDALFGRHQGKDTPFLHLPDGQTLTHAAFLARTARFANAFAACGLIAGDRVAVQIDKSADALALYAACVQAGLVFLPLNTAYKPAEVDYFVSNSGAKVLVCDPAKASGLALVAKGAQARLETLDGSGGGTLADLAEAQSETFDTVDRSQGDLAAFLYTSGTTGRSKGAMLSQANLLSNAETLKEFWRFTERDVLLHALPIFHTHGLFVATNIILLSGGSMVFLPKLDVDELIRFMPRATSLMGVPTFYTRLLDHPGFTRDLTSHMRLFISGSAPLLAETHKAFEARTGHRILERYGMTETNMNTSNPYDGDRRAGTVGHPLPGVELKVTDPDSGTTLPDGEIGVIEVRGPNVFQGYWQMPEKTAAELRSDGFFITGDLGLIDDQGYVQIVGRGKDLIISGGYNIYPKEVELVLDDQPGVLESAVIGVPHGDLGEAPLGILVREKGAEPDSEAILAQLNTDLARFKCPRKLIVVDALPRNTMGKVQKNVLRETYADVFGR
ncbi:malonyl-CoA synthase [Sulfitobacter mediterraneus]|uniref:malonate--CoA ligase n=1 Tax=Sulfitobacter mediterraneus TaxID=83219 RepID=UPI00193A2441|nr:malonyl-CoA synthase [Sulfitobacter mediterraneus]MBM1555516.1 malonyl-CoA synthase [Sulfitobacter mediterraneus]MBM1566931.1 malonyl-CoA synthase [Sulfitobacter mediterraneus]MBM1570733.1 malonyl-CoA synthase [Sulfitobacter mediterraneus]MBM1574533.1 malonyl-CoA synthase [Sulfitobacter mediterraneus]MBM1578474.1 malonyl-CoA synthase [Sulfitobacter mediterraneus]